MEVPSPLPPPPAPLRTIPVSSKAPSSAALTSSHHHQHQPRRRYPFTSPLVATWELPSYRPTYFRLYSSPKTKFLLSLSRCPRLFGFKTPFSRVYSLPVPAAASSLWKRGVRVWSLGPPPAARAQPQPPPIAPTPASSTYSSRILLVDPVLRTPLPDKASTARPAPAIRKDIHQRCCPCCDLVPRCAAQEVTP